MIIVTGTADLIRALEGVRLETLQPVVRGLLGEIGSDAGDYTKAPELPNQRYERSGDLGRGWAGTPLFDLAGRTTLIGTLTNGVRYAARVQGADDQEAVFQGRWRTNEAIMAAWEDRVGERMAAAIDRMLPL